MTQKISAKEIQACGGLEKFIKKAKGNGRQKGQAFETRKAAKVLAKGKLEIVGKNRLERDYASYLAVLQERGLIHAWLYEPFGLRLGAACFYHPDFLVILPDGSLEIHETKGFWRDDARVKIKAAADKFPWFRFVAIQRNKGQWETEVFGAWAD